MLAIADFIAAYKTAFGLYATPSSTSLPCVWNKPKKNVEAKLKRLVDIDVRHDPTPDHPPTYHPKTYTACSFNESYTDTMMDSDLQKLLQGSNAVMLQAFDTTPETQESLPLTLPQLAEMYHIISYKGTFVEYLKEYVTADDIENITRLSKKQSKSSVWKNQRVGSLSSTSIYNAAHYRKGEQDNYVVQQIMGLSTFKGNKATEYGEKNEKIARKMYEKFSHCCKSKHQVSTTGLHIHKECILIRASPDGLIKCRKCGEGTLEIKCVFKENLRHLTGAQIAQLGTYALFMNTENQPSLKKTSKWYAQVQTAMAVTGREWCDFVLYTDPEPSPELTVLRVKFDHFFWENMKDKAMTFYMDYVYPKLMDYEQSGLE